MVRHLLVIYHVYVETYSATGNLHQAYERHNADMFKSKLGQKVKQEKEKNPAEEFVLHISTRHNIQKLSSSTK